MCGIQWYFLIRGYFGTLHWEVLVSHLRIPRKSIIYRTNFWPVKCISVGWSLLIQSYMKMSRPVQELSRDGVWKRHAKTICCLLFLIWLVQETKEIIPRILCLYLLIWGIKTLQSHHFNRRLSCSKAPCNLTTVLEGSVKSAAFPVCFSSCGKTLWYQFTRRLGWKFLHWHNPSGRTMGPGVHSASKWVPAIFLWGKDGRCVGLTTFVCRESLNLRASTSLNPQGLYQGLLGLYLYLGRLQDLFRPFWEGETLSLRGIEQLNPCRLVS